MKEYRVDIGNDEIRAIVAAGVRDGKTYQQISEESGISRSLIANIMGGATRSGTVKKASPGMCRRCGKHPIKPGNMRLCRGCHEEGGEIDPHYGMRYGERVVL